MDSIYFFGTSGDYGFMSNFYSCYFIDDNNITYNCSEQYFMLQKCLLFDPNNIRLQTKIINEIDPKKIKKFGRQVKNFDETIWNQNKVEIMKQGLIYKFTQNEELQKKLLATDDRIIYEASPYDDVWGIGYRKCDAIQIDISNYGQNLLGLCLMDVRTILKNR